jgi:hypothetical protein
MGHRAIVEAVGITEQFKATWVLIDNHPAGYHSGKHLEGRALRTNFAVQRILRNGIITCRPRRAVEMGMPKDAANQLSILWHRCTGPMRCDEFILCSQISASRGF